MSKDKRYRTIKALIELGHIKTFKEIFDTIPKSRVAADMGTNNTRFTKLINNPELFRVKELYQLAELFEVDPVKIIYLVIEQIAPKYRKRK